MHSGTTRSICTVGLGLFLVIFGCVGPDQSAVLNPQAAPPRSRSPQFTEAVPDLRISADEVPADPVPVAQAPSDRPAAGADIPVVPVPPPPLKGDRPLAPVTGPNTPAPQLPALLTPLQLYQQASASFARHDSYIARLTRREAGKTNHAEEIMVFKFRKNPWSIHLKWLSGPGTGREVIFVKGRYENKIHTLLAAGDVPLVAAGKVLSMPVDSPLVRAANRHPITDAGFGSMIEKMGAVLTAMERDHMRLGKFTALGLQQRPDYDSPLYMMEHTLPPGVDDDVPRGGRRLFGFRPDNFMPVLSILYDHRDQEIEYNRFDRLMLGINLDEADFDPEQLGKRPAGLPHNGPPR